MFGDGLLTGPPSHNCLTTSSMEQGSWIHLRPSRPPPALHEPSALLSSGRHTDATCAARPAVIFTRCLSWPFEGRPIRPRAPCAGACSGPSAPSRGRKFLGLGAVFYLA